MHFSRVEEAARHKAKLSRHRDETANEINKKKQELEAKFKQIETINQEIQRFDETGVDHKLKVWKYTRGLNFRNVPLVLALRFAIF